MKAFYSDTFVLPLPPHHRFPMAKYRLVRERIVADGVLDARDLLVPDAAPWPDLALVHTREYLEAVRDGTLGREAQRRIGFPWSPEMVERSRRSVGATMAAGREAVQARPHIAARVRPQTTGRVRLQPEPAAGRFGLPPDAPPLRAAANLAGGTHHAFADRGEGYCVFNDVAVAIRVLQRDGLIQRAAVVDCDVHQGNGTAAIFNGDPSVFTFSMHGANNFPFRKETSDLDIVFEDGADDTAYLVALVRHLAPTLERHRPDLVFYLAGADPYEGDRLGRLRLTIHGLRARDRIVFSACAALDIPVVITMSGGYADDVSAIAAIHVNTIREAAALAESPAAIEN